MNSAPRSAGVCRTIERIPIRRAVRMIRQAISPRLAMRTLANMDGLHDRPCVLKAGADGERITTARERLSLCPISR